MQITSLCGTRSLDVQLVLSRLLRSGRLVLYPARRLIPCFRYKICTLVCALLENTMSLATIPAAPIKFDKFQAADDADCQRRIIAAKEKLGVSVTISSGCLL